MSWQTITLDRRLSAGASPTSATKSEILSFCCFGESLTSKCPLVNDIHAYLRSAPQLLDHSIVLILRGGQGSDIKNAWNPFNVLYNRNRSSRPALWANVSIDARHSFSLFPSQSIIKTSVVRKKSCGIAFGSEITNRSQPRSDL